MNRARLDPNTEYRIDGLPGVPSSRWRLTWALRDQVWFTSQAPSFARVAVDLERLFEVRPGHLHYVASG
jgi:hypothetical protein